MSSQIDFWEDLPDYSTMTFEEEEQEYVVRDHIDRAQDIQLQALKGDKGGFVNDYLQTYAHTTEAPDMIIAAGALTCISAALGRHCWLSQGAHTLGLNNYLMVVGPSGSNKSSAMNLARDHIERIEGVITLGANNTPEALEKIISQAEGAPICLFIDEYGSLKAMSEKSYGGGLEPLLTEAYGGRITRRTLSKDVEAIRNQPNRIGCFLNSYSCTTPVWLNSALGDIRSGALARYCMLFHGYSNKVIYQQPKPDPMRQLALDEKLELIRSSAEKRYERGEAEAFLSTDAIADVGEPWYRDWKQKLRNHPRRDIIESLQKRVDWIARKQAVLLYVADHPEERPIVTPEYLQRAYTIADSILGVYEHKLATGWLADPDQQAIHRVRDYLQNNQWATEVQLAEWCEMTLLSMRTILSSMTKSGIIREESDNSVIRYRLF